MSFTVHDADGESIMAMMLLPESMGFSGGRGAFSLKVDSPPASPPKKLRTECVPVLRRCLIPVGAFYEWSGPKGRKRTHRFTRTNGKLFWIAGIWEVSHKFGPCFSMITTDANERMAPIHDRMPAILEEGKIEGYLAGEMSRFLPLSESLRVEDAPNPLVKTSGDECAGGAFLKSVEFTEVIGSGLGIGVHAAKNVSFGFAFPNREDPGLFARCFPKRIDQK